MAARPNLTPEQVDQICALRERGWSERRLALRFEVPLHSVRWLLLREGVDPRHLAAVPPPPVPEARKVIVRDGRPVIRFCRADDARLLALAGEGLSPHAIGRRLNPPRAHSSVRGRLFTLARHEARAERAEALR